MDVAAAKVNPSGQELYEFGPFRVDARRQILLRAGEPVQLTPKTFQILLVLVRHGQELVTKDDLMKAVWSDTFVEEANLSRNIFMLRKALGESPRDHQYIVTVPGRGYRLAESVRLLPDQEISILAATHSKVQVQISETKLWQWSATILALLLAAGALVLRFPFRHRPVLSEKDTLVLADFGNSTGDRVFDGTLRQGLAIQLEESPFLSLVSEQRIETVLRLMAKPADSRLTPELAFQVCERTGSAAVLEGSIVGVGTQYVLALRARYCRTGDVLDDEQVQVAKKEDVLNALTRLARGFRSHVGESLAGLQRRGAPLSEATTPSLQALEVYTTGWRVHVSEGSAGAIPFFRRATQIDPGFAMAHAALGRMYADIEEPDLSSESIRRAWQLRDRSSDREKFNISANYELLVTGNLEKARETTEAWAQSYPREVWPHLTLSGMINKATGQYEKAVTEAQKAVDLDPDYAMAYYNLAVNNVYLDRFERAEEILRRADDRRLHMDEFAMLEYDLAFLRSDRAATERAVARARARSAAASWISNKEALALGYSGHLQQARMKCRLAVAQAQHASQRERAGTWEATAAVREALLSNAAEATKRATAALEFSRSRDVEYGAALAMAVSGDFSHSKALANDLETRFPEDTLVQFSYLPVLRASLALKREDTAGALEALQFAIPNELGVTPTWFGALYAPYVRGQVYLASNQGVKAAAEFQRIVDHPGIVQIDLIGALAHLQLGRAFVLGGDKIKAKAAYQHFFALWNDADPDIPVLKQAKAEYANLNW